MTVEMVKVFMTIQSSSNCAVVRWYGGMVVRWYGGTVVRWCGGTVMRWCSEPYLENHVKYELDKEYNLDLRSYPTPTCTES